MKKIGKLLLCPMMFCVLIIMLFLVTNKVKYNRVAEYHIPKEHSKSKALDKSNLQPDIKICKLKDAKQWQFDNKGTFNLFYNSCENWGDDVPKSIKGIDIGIKKENISNCSEETIVAVLDTTVALDSLCIKENIWINRKEENDGLDNDNNGYIDDCIGYNFLEKNNRVNGKYGHHGTFIMGVLCGKTSKIKYTNVIGDYNVKFMCLPVLKDLAEDTNIDNVIEAIQYAENNGAKICSLSLGTYLYNKKFEDVIKKSKMLFVVASGNDGLNIDDKISIYPACFQEDNIITVAAMRSDGCMDSTSNYGKRNVDLAAPGTNILGILPNGKFTYLSGSSFAVPFVTGVAAKIYNTFHNNISSNKVKSIILQNVKKNANLQDKVKTSGYISEENVFKSKEITYVN